MSTSCLNVCAGNAKQPYLAQFGFIDIYLRSADSGVVVANWTHVPIGRGEIQSCADDEWLGRAGPRVYTGENISWNFQYILVQSGTEITGAEQAEAPFTVLRESFLHPPPPFDQIVLTIDCRNGTTQFRCFGVPVQR